MEWGRGWGRGATGGATGGCESASEGCESSDELVILGGGHPRGGLEAPRTGSGMTRVGAVRRGRHGRGRSDGLGSSCRPPHAAPTRRRPRLGSSHGRMAPPTKRTARCSRRPPGGPRQTADGPTRSARARGASGGTEHGHNRRAAAWSAARDEGARASAPKSDVSHGGVRNSVPRRVRGPDALYAVAKRGAPFDDSQIQSTNSSIFSGAL